MLEFIDQEDRRFLRPVARVEAQEFLQEQLKEVEAKISSQRDYLERHYSPEESSRRGIEQMLRVYEQEKDIIETLMHDCQEEILPDVFHRRMLEIDRALANARVEGLPSIGAESSYRQLRMEMELLRDLLRRWNHHIRTSSQKESQE